MIHRAILGSLERFIAILTEHLGGKWPLWLSPRQACVIPISEKSEEFANATFESLKRQGFQVEIDLSANSLNKKIRNAQVS